MAANHRNRLFSGAAKHVNEAAGASDEPLFAEHAVLAAQAVEFRALIRGQPVLAPPLVAVVGADAGGGRTGNGSRVLVRYGAGTATAPDRYDTGPRTAFAARDGSVQAFGRRASRLATACCMAHELSDNGWPPSLTRPAGPARNKGGAQLNDATQAR